MVRSGNGRQRTTGKGRGVRDKEEKGRVGQVFLLGHSKG